MTLVFLSRASNGRLNPSACRRCQSSWACSALSPRSLASSIRREMDRVSPLTTLRQWTAPISLPPLCPPSRRRQENAASQEASGSCEASVRKSPVTAVPERPRNTRSQKPKRPVSCVGVRLSEYSHQASAKLGYSVFAQLSRIARGGLAARETPTD